MLIVSGWLIAAILLVEGIVRAGAWPAGSEALVVAADGASWVAVVLLAGAALGAWRVLRQQPLVVLALGLWVVALAIRLFGQAPGLEVAGGAAAAGALGALTAAVARWPTQADRPRRLGARAQEALRRYRILALATLGAFFLSQVLGGLIALQSTIDACLVFPICPSPAEPAQLQMTHRVLVAPVILLVGLLWWLTHRGTNDTGLRRAAATALGLTLAQALIGALQIAFVSQAFVTGVAAARVAHLALGVCAWVALSWLAAQVLRLPELDRHTQAPAPAPASAGEQPAELRRSSLLKDYVSLTKPGVISLLIFTTLAGMFITPAGLPSLSLVLWTLLGGWLMAAGAHALNCYIDRDIDLLMGRTSRRPIPSNRIPAWHALVLGVALGVVAFTILVVFVNWLAAALALAGYMYYVFVYSLWLKRTSPNNIVIGGGAGAFPPLVGWAAATGSLTLPSLFLFAIIFYWTPPHFWALALIRQKDYARAGVPMLPVVAGDAETKRQILLYTLLMFVLTLLPTPLQMFGLGYLAASIVLGAWFIWYVVRLLRDGSTGSAWGLYKFSLLYLALLFAAMVVDRVWLA